MHRVDIGLTKSVQHDFIYSIAVICVYRTHFPQGILGQPFDLFFSMSIFPCLRISLNIFQLMKLNNGFKPNIIISVLFLPLCVSPITRMHKGDA